LNALESRGLTGLTDGAGRYRLERIPPGRYYILVGINIPRFYYPGVADLDRATAIQVTAGATTEVPETVVPGGTVTGRVIDITTGEGIRIDNLVLCCDYFKQIQFSQNGIKQGSPFMAALSNDGSFTFPFVPTGNYAMSVVDKGEQSVSWALAVGPNGAPGLQLDLTDGGEVQGTVLDQTGMPVSADVRLVPKPANSVVNTISAPTHTAEGPYLFENGTKLGVRVFLRRILVPRPYPSLEDIQDLILKTVTAPERLRLATSGPDGHFTFPKVHPGTYMLDVNAGGVVLAGREIQVGLAGLSNVSLQVPAIQVTGRVVASGGSPLPKLNYIRIVRVGSDTDVFYGFPNTEGRFSLALVRGTYRVFTENLGPSVQSVSDGSRDITNTEFTVEAGRNLQIDVMLRP
jgi:hypothetical protein